MKASFWVLLSLVIVATVSQDIWLRYSDFKFAKTEGRYELTIAISGGSGSYDWNYSWLPNGWLGQGNIIYIPQEMFKVQEYYAFKIQIIDEMEKIQYEKTVFISLNERSIIDIFEGEYSIDLTNQQYFSTLTTQRRQQIQKILASVSQTTTVSQSNTLIRSNTRGSISTSISVPNYNFPSFGQIDEKISQGNIVYLRTVISASISSGRNCRQIATFLANLLSKIQAYITVVKEQRIQIEQSLLMIREEIIFIQQQISRLQTSSINVQYLEQQITQFRSKVTQIISQRQQFEVNIQQQRVLITQFEAEIKQIRVTLIAKFESEYKLVIEKVLKIDQEIEIYLKKIAELRLQKTVYVQQGNSIKIRIEEQESRIKKLVISIREIQIKIRAWEKRIQELIIIIRSYQVQITDIRKQIQIGFTQVNSQFTVLRASLQTKQTEELTKKRRSSELIRIFEVLTGAIVEFEASINSQYYSCYNFKGSIRTDYSFEGIRIGGSIGQYRSQIGSQFGSSSSQFINYIQAIYGITPISNYGFSGNLYTISIYSPSWIDVYGMTQIQNDFSCSIDSSLTSLFSSSYGRVSSIDRNIVGIIDDFGVAHSLHLGTCTKIQTTSSIGILQIGDTIFYKGNNIGSHYNAYHVTCV